MTLVPIILLSVRILQRDCIFAWCRVTASLFKGSASEMGSSSSFYSGYANVHCRMSMRCFRKSIFVEYERDINGELKVGMTYMNFQLSSVWVILLEGYYELDLIWSVEFYRVMNKINKRSPCNLIGRYRLMQGNWYKNIGPRHYGKELDLTWMIVLNDSSVHSISPQLVPYFMIVRLIYMVFIVWMALWYTMWFK